MAKELELVEKISRDVRDDIKKVGFDILNIERKLYISQPSAANNSGTGGSWLENNTILVYDLDSRELEEIELATNYPFSFNYDENCQILRVKHPKSYLQEHVVTLLNLQTGEQKVLKFASDSETLL